MPRATLLPASWVRRPHRPGDRPTRPSFAAGTPNGLGASGHPQVAGDRQLHAGAEHQYWRRPPVSTIAGSSPKPRSTPVRASVNSPRSTPAMSAPDHQAGGVPVSTRTLARFPSTCCRLGVEKARSRAAWSTALRLSGRSMVTRATLLRHSNRMPFALSWSPARPSPSPR